VQIKLTDKAREALLFAELIAWARKDTCVQIDDLCFALRQQQNTTARKVASKLKESQLNRIGFMRSREGELFAKFAPSRSLEFYKIPLGDAIFKTLEKCAIECLDLGYEGDITTGQILAQILFDSIDFAKNLKEAEFEIDHFKSVLLSIAIDETAVNKEITAGNSTLSKFNRLALNWLRDGNLTDELKHSIGLDSAEFDFLRTLQLIKYLGESDNREIPDIKPPYTRGIKEKTRRDLELIDSFVAARNLPEAEPGLLGIYMNNPQELILFYENQFVMVDGSQSASFKYSDLNTVETFYHEDDGNGKEVASIAIAGGDSFDFEMEIPARTNEIHDVFLLENFIENTREPQAISEIDSNTDFVAFLRRQNENMDLYYRLAYKTEELGQLGWNDVDCEDEEKGAQHTLLLRLLAILVTVPVQSMSLSVSRSKQVS